jgi:hypothetical protein
MDGEEMIILSKLNKMRKRVVEILILPLFILKDLWLLIKLEKEEELKEVLASKLMNFYNNNDFS